MGRRKQFRPRRSGGLLEPQVSDAQVTKCDGADAKDGKSVEVDEPFYVEIEKSSRGCEEHFDIGEILLLNLIVGEEFRGNILAEKFDEDANFFIRFKLCNLNGHLGRMKFGHWPALSEKNTSLEFVLRSTHEGQQKDFVMLSGVVDGSEGGVTGLVHLCSLKYFTLRPNMGIELVDSMPPVRIRVEILKSMFNECESLIDNTKQLWRKSMMNVMAWLRPEVMMSETRYGCSSLKMDIDAPHVLDGESSEIKPMKFEVSSFYEAIKPSKDANMLENHLPDLLPKLRPYQRRAAHWMVQREKGDEDLSCRNETSCIAFPLCVPLSVIDTSRRIYFNPFSGSISLNRGCSLAYVSGGILADEMGLGKTVELLACILTNQMPSVKVPVNSNATMHEFPNERFTRLKRERVECICGAVSESSKYKGLWVQCDVCDAWQHADCVAYSPKTNKCRYSGNVDQEKLGIGHSKKCKKKKNEIKVIEMDEEFICQTCIMLMQATQPPIATGATLIVCPTPILLQWHSEILRHTNLGALKVCIYEGAKRTTLADVPVIDIDEILAADIVLTTYDVLKEDLPHDSQRHEGDQRFLRHMKRYPVVPTLLTRVLWWRVCLDEAQMVEGRAASAAELALRLHAKHRWCITGTPIQRELDDLYGLLRFLRASPFDVFRWWTDVISGPYERGDAAAISFTHKFFKQLMWRSSKVHVWDELQLPPQEECVSWLTLSPIEQHFYQRQHESCVDIAREVVASFKNDAESDKSSDGILFDSSIQHSITTREAAKLFNSLLKLRQACCHPQVGSSGLRSWQKSPMTMEDILSILIGKTKLEGEDALRKLVVALNGLAGIAIIKEDTSQAISLYREALSLVDEHSDDFRLDPLLNIHIHHNLVDILSLESLPALGCLEEILNETYTNTEKDFHAEEMNATHCTNLARISENSQNRSSCLPRQGPPHDAESNISTYIGCLKESCADLKQKFLAVYNSRFSVAQLEFQKLNEQVCDAFRKRKSQEVIWWLDSLHHIEKNQDLSEVLFQKIREALSGNLNKKSRISASFSSITALKYYVQTGLDALEESRDTLLDRLLEIGKTMEDPREEDVARVRYCRNCNSDSNGPPCTHCELDELFQVYEARLFRLNKRNNGEVIISAEEAVNLQKKTSALNRFYWNLSRENKTSTSSHSDFMDDDGRKRDAGEKVTTSKSPSDLEIILTIIRNNFRGFLEKDGAASARKQLDLLEAMRKEYALARTLAIAQAQVLRAHDELKMATSRLRLRENVDDTSIDALSLEELDVAGVENSSEKFLALDSLSRIRGKLRYLKGLAESNQRVSVGSLDGSLLDGGAQPAGSCAGVKPVISCPICHDQLGTRKFVFQCGHTTCCKCFFAMTEGRYHRRDRVVCPICRQASDFGNIALADEKHDESDGSHDKSEASITIQGSYSTKIEAVTRRILWINASEPDSKILVFSSWNDVLDVLQHAFNANGITYIRMKGGRKSQNAVSHFRGQPSSPKGAKPPQVLLILIQHGANGLNLLEAAHVILVEPLLNPAAEAQAIGRVHRIGQQQKTLVHRFIVKSTVEESIYKMNKSRNTSSFISGNRKNQDQPCLTLGDLQSLFRVAPPPPFIAEDQVTNGSLRDLPPSAAAVIAAEQRWMR